VKGGIDHRARKHHIIEKSVPLFAKVGYQEVTFQMLAAHCDVARTVLYRYFRDKRQIFDYAIAEVISRIVRRHNEIVHSDTSAAARLSQICSVVTATLFDNREFLLVIIEFVMSRKREGYDMSRRIKKFTMGLKRIIHTLLLWGMHRGEFRAGLDADAVTGLIYAVFESATLRLTVSDDAVQAEVLDELGHILKGLKK